MNNVKPMLRDVAANIAYFTGATYYAARNNLTIVTFHRILTQFQLNQYPLKNLAVTCEEFSWLISFFKENYTCGTLQEVMNLFEAGERPKKPFLAITFDDGQRDNYDNAIPILEAHQIKATFFIAINGVINDTNLWHDNIAYSLQNLLKDHNSSLEELLRQHGLTMDDSLEDKIAPIVGYAKKLPDEQRLKLEHQLLQIDSGRPCPAWDGVMNWDQVKSLVTKGHEVGSHTFSHPILTNCSESKIIEEVHHSKLFLEETLGSSVNAFCYPNGDYDLNIVHIVKTAGYGHAVTTNWGLNSKSTSIFELKRCDIQSQTSISRYGKLSRPRLAMRISGLQPGL
jgi:peptidoglycan/xylan/chitin deacetylase (PgdA/CDA1 family)